MRAEDVYDAWEESQVAGLKQLLIRIRKAGGDSLLSMEVQLDKTSDAQIKALRRRNFVVVKKDLENNQTIKKVLISWEHLNK